MKDFIINKNDVEALKKLNDFLPDKIFDSHMHISHLPCGARQNLTLKNYYADMSNIFFNRQLSVNAITFPELALKDKQERSNALNFLVNQLNEYSNNVGELCVFPTDTYEDINEQLLSDKIRGLKCYHVYADKQQTNQCNIAEYLPESALEIANKRNMFITLHLVKDKSLADKDNLNYIKAMAKKYPNAILILAHAARSFASWTVFDVVNELKSFDNIWFDFSAICESPAMTYILKKIGYKKCTWGSDYPTAMFSGKAISIGDGFYWISENDLINFNKNSAINNYHIITENLLAVKQACILTDATQNDIEDLFYNNAKNLMTK